MQEIYFGGTGSAASLSQKAGETGIYMSNSSVLFSLEFSLLVLGMSVPDILLLAVGMGRFVELVELLTGVIKPTEDGLPKKCCIRQPWWEKRIQQTVSPWTFLLGDVQTLSCFLVMNEK